MQDAARHRRAARIAVGTGQNQRAAALLDEAAAPGDGRRQDRVAGAVGRERTAAQRNRAAAARERSDALAAAVEIERAAVDRERSARRQRTAGAELQCTLVDRRAAGIGAGASQGQRPAPLLDEAAAAGDHRSEGGVAGAVGRQRAAAERNRPAAARERPHRLVVAVEVERAAIDREHAARRQRAASPELQHAAIDRRAADVAVGPREGHRAGAGLGQAARPRQDTGVAAVARLIEHHRSIVDDVALQARRRALQGALLDHRAAGVAICAREDQRARPRLGQRPAACDRALQGERIAVAVEDAAAQAQLDGAIAAEARQGLHCGARRHHELAGRRTEGCIIGDPHHATAHHRAAGVTVGTGERHLAWPHQHHAAVAADIAAEGHIVRPVEGQHALRTVHRDIAHDCARRAAIAELQDAACDRRGAGVSIVLRQDQRAGARLGEGTRPRHDARVGADGRLVEHDGGIVGDVPLQARRASDQRAAQYRRATAIGVRAR